MKRETRILFLTGGAASGKSSEAGRLAEIAGGDQVTFIATATASDDEMAEKITAHRNNRPIAWPTIEIGSDGQLATAIASVVTPVAIIDCLTIFVATKLVKRQKSSHDVAVEISQIVTAMQNHSCCSLFIVVSNEVGWGIVPSDAISRLFREVLGSANKQLMAAANEAFLMVSGQPLKIK